MKNCGFVFSFLILAMGAWAQGSLQFNQVLLVDTALRTVPANKVWKITAISGSEFRNNVCVDISPNSTHELNSARCAVTTTLSTFLTYTISFFWVNGKRVINSIEGLPTSSSTFYQFTNCTGGGSGNFNFTCGNKSTNPNILPMWLPSGTTLRSGGPNTWLSVLEFNVIP